VSKTQDRARAVIAYRAARNMRLVATSPTPTSTHWQSCTKRSCTRYSTAFFRYARQHATADHPTCGLMTTAAGNLNVDRRALRWKLVRGSSSDQSIATWSSSGSVKHSGSRAGRHEKCGSRLTTSWIEVSCPPTPLPALYGVSSFFFDKKSRGHSRVYVWRCRPGLHCH